VSARLFAGGASHCASLTARTSSGLAIAIEPARKIKLTNMPNGIRNDMSPQPRTIMAINPSAVRFVPDTGDPGK
jgi:hypothetical protein